ncbi:DUF7009 family protein [Flavobacteriaceae bacterium M23B6Z8]
MKIRIKGNSVRLRLTKSEVEAFCEEGIYEEKTRFTTKTLTYRIIAKKNIHLLEADYQEDIITVYFPDAKRTEWLTTDCVGYNNEVDWNDHTALSVLIEKDFTCLDNTAEDQSDNYPNPKL